MRRHGCPEALARARAIGVTLVQDGLGPQEAANVLGVNVSSVCRWVEQFKRDGWAGLEPAPVSGRPPKLSPRQSERVVAWIRKHGPQAFGFRTEHWTARRVAAVIEQRMGVHFNHRYLNDWLGRHGISPQLPQRVPRERDPVAIARWLAYDWPAIKRGRPTEAQHSFSPTKAAF